LNKNAVDIVFQSKMIAYIDGRELSSFGMVSRLSQRKSNLKNGDLSVKEKAFMEEIDEDVSLRIY
jgi:hypothetical protein